MDNVSFVKQDWVPWQGNISIQKLFTGFPSVHTMYPLVFIIKLLVDSLELTIVVGVTTLDRCLRLDPAELWLMKCNDRCVREVTQNAGDEELGIAYKARFRRLYIKTAYQLCYATLLYS